MQTTCSPMAKSMGLELANAASAASARGSDSSMVAAPATAGCADAAEDSGTAAPPVFTGADGVPAPAPVASASPVEAIAALPIAATRAWASGGRLVPDGCAVPLLVPLDAEVVAPAGGAVDDAGAPAAVRVVPGSLVRRLRTCVVVVAPKATVVTTAAAWPVRR